MSSGLWWHLIRFERTLAHGWCYFFAWPYFNGVDFGSLFLPWISKVPVFLDEFCLLLCFVESRFALKISIEGGSDREGDHDASREWLPQYCLSQQ